MTSRYQVLTQLATGGMGEILLARRVGPAGFEKLVVLKKPLALASGSRHLVAALVEEARLLARINHPNVCQIHDLEEADGEYFLALEYLEGLSGWALLTDAELTRRALEPAIACGIVAQACDGLHAIHSLRNPDGTPAGVVHRDVSPSNVFLTEAGTAKILDLGIAKHVDSQDKTPDGRVKGKLPYLSPEQVAGKALDARSDVFSLGLVLYDLVRSVRPSGDRIGALACGSLELDALPPALRDVVRRATAADRAARFSSANDMGDALRRAGAASPRELGRWLAERFAGDLAQRRAELAKALAVGTDASGSATLFLDMQSVLAPAAEPEPMRSRMTERLELDDEAAPAAPPRRGRRLAIIAGTSAVAIAVGVIAGLRFSSGGQVADAAPPAIAMAPAPAPAPVAAPPAPPEVAPIDAAIAIEVDPAPAPVVAPARPPRSSATHAAKGSLYIESRPFAVVKLDGRSLGDTPINWFAVAAGRHVIHATTADGRVRDVPVQIEAGRKRTVLIDWSKP